MTTESFYEGMNIDVPRIAANLEPLFESGVRWKCGDTVFSYGAVDEEFARMMVETGSGSELPGSSEFPHPLALVQQSFPKFYNPAN